MKKIISVLIICTMITGCSAKNEYSGNSLAEKPAVSSVEDSANSTDSTSEETSSAKAEKSSSTSSIKSESASIKVPASSVSSAASAVTSSKPENTGEKTETSSVVSTSATSTPSEPVVKEPTWNEETVSEILYVSKEGIYSRKKAIVGSEAVKKYGLNDKVSIVAVTDTGYYKLEDGSFIHKDYLSDKETAAPKPVEVEKPVTPSKPSASGAISADAERLLNSVSLNPMKTNESDLDELVEDLLGQITNSGMSTAQKVTAVYDYIAKTFTYGVPATVYEAESNYHSDFDFIVTSHAYTVLVNKVGKCTDYSSLFVVMTRAIGLESYLVSGQVSAKSGGTTGHNWAIVKINGEYYVFDPQVEQNNTYNGQITHTYFCRSETSMSSMYTYEVSGTLSICLSLSEDDIKADNARDLAIALFGNFAVDEGEKSYKIHIGYN